MSRRKRGLVPSLHLRACSVTEGMNAFMLNNLEPFCERKKTSGGVMSKDNDGNSKRRLACYMRCSVSCLSYPLRGYHFLRMHEPSIRKPIMHQSSHA